MIGYVQHQSGKAKNKERMGLNMKAKKQEKMKPHDSGKVKKPFKERFMREMRRNGALYLMVAIPLIYIIVFHYIPMYGIQIAFRDYKVGGGITGGKFVGFKHFIRFFTNYKFEELLVNTIAISLYSLATFPFSIILALLLNYVKNMRFKKAVQLVSYAPHFISTVVMVGMIIQFLDARTGVINLLIKFFGGEAQNWLLDPGNFRHIYIWSGVWQGVGYGSIMYISALSGVSPELHEAAIIDGASIPQRIWNVDLPSIMPTIAITLIMRCGSILSVGYEKVYLMQNSLNLSTSEIISTYVYKQGIANEFPQYSYSTAVGLATSVVNIIMLLICNKLCSKLAGSSLF